MVQDLLQELKPEIFQSYRKVGVHPFNDDVIPQEKFRPDVWIRWQCAKNANRTTAALANIDVTDNENVNVLEVGPTNVSFKKIKIKESSSSESDDDCEIKEIHQDTDDDIDFLGENKALVIKKASVILHLKLILEFCWNIARI